MINKPKLLFVYPYLIKNMKILKIQVDKEFCLFSINQRLI